MASYPATHFILPDLENQGGPWSVIYTGKQIMDPFMFVITEFCFDGYFSAKPFLILTAERELLLDSLESLA